MKEFKVKSSEEIAKLNEEDNAKYLDFIRIRNLHVITAIERFISCIVFSLTSWEATKIYWAELGTKSY